MVSVDFEHVLWKLLSLDALDLLDWKYAPSFKRGHCIRLAIAYFMNAVDIEVL